MCDHVVCLLDYAYYLNTKHDICKIIFFHVVMPNCN